MTLTRTLLTHRELVDALRERQCVPHTQPAAGDGHASLLLRLTGVGRRDAKALTRERGLCQVLPLLSIILPPSCPCSLRVRGKRRASAKSVNPMQGLELCQATDGCLVFGRQLLPVYLPEIRITGRRDRWRRREGIGLNAGPERDLSRQGLRDSGLKKEGKPPWR
jgi:hypothetical protein